MPHVEKLIRGRILSYFQNPRLGGQAFTYLEKGVMRLKGGKIVEIGGLALLQNHPHLPVEDFSAQLIMAGFIDPHIHMPQTQVIASYGKELLDWLNLYTFPQESRYNDAEIAQFNADFLISTLISHGTTCASAFCTSHPTSVDAYFKAGEKYNMCLFGGKVLMDRNAPEPLLDTPQRAYDESTALIKTWHGQGRAHYVITPRFAITSTPAQLEMAGVLARENSHLAIQTHLSENKAEIALTLSLFPQQKNYLEIYHHYGLVRENAFFGHAIHLEPQEYALLGATKAKAVHCPTSNLFLGSGLFEMARMVREGIDYGIASDIGGGTSYSMLQTLNETYKIQALLGHSYSPHQGFYDITLGNAHILGAQAQIGSIEAGKMADFIVLNAHATPAMAHRMARVETLEEELFLLSIMGDDRAVMATFIAGERVK
jgi:guanine deaminase